MAEPQATTRFLTFRKLLRSCLLGRAITPIWHPLLFLFIFLVANNSIYILAQQSESAPDTNLSSMTDADLKHYANDKYWSDNYSSALSAIEILIQRSHCLLDHLDHECLELYMNLAVCLMQENQLDKARAILIKLLSFAKTEKTNNNCGMDEPDTLFFLAECDYRIGSFKHAENLYQEALTKYRECLPSLSTDLAPCIDGLVGCFYRRNDYENALPLLTEYVKIDALNRGTDDLTTAWSLLNLTDVLKKLHRASEALPLYEKAIYIFRQVNADRILAEYIKSKPTPEELDSFKTRLRSYVFGVADRADLSTGGSIFRELTKEINFADKPQQRPYDFYNWRLKRTRIMDAPGLVTMNPNLPLKGLIICVHGLGLHHGTYQEFANQMAKRGFGVIAFDVRGFGSYRESKGYDKIDLNDSIEDIGNILKFLRRDYPNQNIFLLGESMGGALALQVASAHTDLIDGLVCSVPSGTRFGATTTDVKVALKLLTHRNKPFDIGKRIVKQATKEESLRHEWQTDPEARLTLSPLELFQFQRFMNQNLKAAEHLSKLPVVIFQGYGDKLVKPEGTLALYNALTTEDKDLVFVGHAEHLIFEEGQFKPSVINGLTGWLSSHTKDNAATESL